MASRNLGRVCLQVLVDEEMRWSEEEGVNSEICGVLWDGGRRAAPGLGDKKESGEYPLILLSSSLLIS